MSQEDHVVLLDQSCQGQYPPTKQKENQALLSYVYLFLNTHMEPLSLAMNVSPKPVRVISPVLVPRPPLRAFVERQFIHLNT